MKTDKIAQKLADILPDRPIVPGMSNPDTSKLVEQEATRIKSKQDAKELARIKYLEKSRLRSLKEKQEKRQSLAEELGFIKDVCIPYNFIICHITSYTVFLPVYYFPTSIDVTKRI